jgi:hypothetical protein
MFLVDILAKQKLPTMLNAVGSKNTEAGVYKSEAFMPDGVNKSVPFISIIYGLTFHKF